MTNPYLIEAVKELRALSAELRKQDRTKTAMAELTSTGVINEEEAQDYLATIARHGGGNATEVAVEVIKQAKSATKTASFGKPVVHEKAASNDIEGGRWADHDNDFLNCDFGG